MAVEIKELVIRTVLERTTQSKSSSTQQIQLEIKRQFEAYKSQIVEQCIEIISDSVKKQSER
jgi:hypothetical protein